MQGLLAASGPTGKAWHSCCAPTWQHACDSSSYSRHGWRARRTARGATDAGSGATTDGAVHIGRRQFCGRLRHGADGAAGERDDRPCRRWQRCAAALTCRGCVAAGAAVCAQRCRLLACLVPASPMDPASGPAVPKETRHLLCRSAYLPATRWWRMCGWACAHAPTPPTCQHPPTALRLSTAMAHWLCSFRSTSKRAAASRWLCPPPLVAAWHLLLSAAARRAPVCGRAYTLVARLPAPSPLGTCQHLAASGVLPPPAPFSPRHPHKHTHTQLAPRP